MRHRAESTQLNVIARSPFHLYYEGLAKSVSAANRIGPFDILPGHADFFSVMTPGQVVIDPGSGELVDFTITNGIISVQGEQVVLFVNI